MSRSGGRRWRPCVPGVYIACVLAAGCSSAPPLEEGRASSSPPTDARPTTGRGARESEVTIPTPEVPVERAVPAAAGPELLITLVETPPPEDELAKDEPSAAPEDRWAFSVAGKTLDDAEALATRLTEEADRYARPVNEGGLGHGWETTAEGSRLSRLEVRVEAPSSAPTDRVRDVFEACHAAGIYRVTLRTRGR